MSLSLVLHDRNARGSVAHAIGGDHEPSAGIALASRRGDAWTAAAKWASQALSWISWLIVARVLTPEEGKERKDGA